jgi:hypothetical protein
LIQTDMSKGPTMNRRRRIPAILAALTLAGMLVPLLASPAAAHEHRKVGKYNLVVGFGTEPAFTGNPNSVQLILTDAKDKPVTTLRDTLKVAVTSGNAEAKEMTLEPNFGDGWGEQGDYRAFFIPTTAGQYSFKFSGTIGGQKIDQTFTSGPKSFSDMGDPAELQYPVQDPSGTQLTARIDREAARTQAALTEQRDQARDDAASARTLAIIGLVVGALGLLAGGTALAMRRRPPALAAGPSAPADTAVRQDVSR